MSTFTIPADVWACHRPGVPFVAAIVEGECLCGEFGDVIHEFMIHGQRLGPPAWLVALRDARCETCGGTGTLKQLGALKSGSHSQLVSEDVACPRCVGGRLLHDVRVGGVTHCGRCDSTLMHDHGTHEWEPWTVRCLVDVVPVVDPDTAGREPQRPAVVVYDESGRRVYYERQRTPQYGDVRLTPAHVDALAAACGKPPADWVGGYAVIVNVA